MGFFKNFFKKEVKLPEDRPSGIYKFYVEDIFTIKNLGCIVVGVVEDADINLGDEIYVIDVNGNRFKSKIAGMENPKVGKMSTAPVGSNVGILLKDVDASQLHKGDLLTNDITIQ